MGRRVRVAGLRFCCAAAAAWRARDTSTEKGRGREEETGGSRLATVGGGAYRWATRGFARLKIRVGGSGDSGEGRGAAWALGRRVDLGPVDGSVAVEKARVVCELLEEANNSLH